MSGYAPIEDYALVADGHGAALVRRDGSVDWCCLQRVDAASVFGRLLDEERGGCCTLKPVGGRGEPERAYLDGTLVLETTFTTPGGRARVLDLLPVDADDPRRSHRQLLRVVEGVEGSVAFDVAIRPRFDYGTATPWIRAAPDGAHYALAGDDALVIGCDAELRRTRGPALEGRLEVRAGERARVAIGYVDAALIDADPPAPPDRAELDRRLDETIRWWREWSSRAELPGADGAGVLRSAIILKALSNPRTGAIAAAPTTSLSESLDGGRTWDYRYAWVRDSVFGVRSLVELGFSQEADALRRFVQRSAAGHAEELRVAYGVGGERRLPEQELGLLDGWRGIRPVRIGNAASLQRQLDSLGQVLELTWRWHALGRAPDDELWAFVCDIVDRAAREWELPDRGIWEWRGAPKHFTHSKAMCWVALDRGIRLAEDSGRDAPLERWRATRDAIAEAVWTRGYDPQRNTLVQVFGEPELDAALLRLPSVEFVDWCDERMVGTADAILRELIDGGLVRRYCVDDEQPGKEGAFLACSFWLVECLARQGRGPEARELFERVVQTRNDLGLFSEEFDTAGGVMLGNFPQALTHFSHIEAALALDAVGFQTARS